MAFSLVILLPLHYLMSKLYGVSLQKDTHIEDLVTGVNKCAHRLTTLLQEDVLAGDNWRLMRCADRRALEDPEFRKYACILLIESSDTSSKSMFPHTAVHLGFSLAVTPIAGYVRGTVNSSCCWPRAQKIV